MIYVLLSRSDNFLINNFSRPWENFLRPRVFLFFRTPTYKDQVTFIFFGAFCDQAPELIFYRSHFLKILGRFFIVSTFKWKIKINLMITTPTLISIKKNAKNKHTHPLLLYNKLSNKT